MSYAMDAVAGTNTIIYNKNIRRLIICIEFIVFDRPNPLNAV